MISLRSATGADIEGIATVVRDVWKQAILPDVCRAHIEDNTHALWVATEDEEVAGFASAFLTAVADTRRWEIDLLAVRRASQGQGLGTHLIERISEAGQPLGVSLTQALIRVENVASQRAFENAGFTTDARVHRLFLWPPEPGAAAGPCPGAVALLPVDTLTYRGLWIEGLASVPPEAQHRAVAAARSMIAREGHANTGAVIPVDEEHLLSPDLREDAAMHGEYYWFTGSQSVKRNAQRSEHGPCAARPSSCAPLAHPRSPRPKGSVYLTPVQLPRPLVPACFGPASRQS
ncbi:MAG: GNAT family N-acetyltransferase [Chloroflexota bacterium]|nr:GNAT family N-acetyltransferase [Chloroflexota bacterium]